MNKQIKSAVVAQQSAEQFIKDLQALHAGITDPLAPGRTSAGSTAS